MQKFFYRQSQRGKFGGGKQNLLRGTSQSQAKNDDFGLCSAL